MPPLGGDNVTIIEDEPAAPPATEVPTVETPVIPSSPTPPPMLPDRQRFPEELTPPPISPATTALDQEEIPKSPEDVVKGPVEGEIVAVTSPEKIPDGSENPDLPTDGVQPPLQNIEETGQESVSGVSGKDVSVVEEPKPKEHHILDELQKKILTRADQDQLQYPDGKPKGRPRKKTGEKEARNAKDEKDKGKGRQGRSKVKGKGEEDQEGQTEKETGKGRRGRSKVKGEGEEDQEGQTEKGKGKGRRGRSKVTGKGEEDQEGQTEKEGRGRRGRSKVTGKGEEDQEGQTEKGKGKGRRGRSKVKGQEGKEEEQDPNPKKSKAPRKDPVKKSLEAVFEEVAKEETEEKTEEPKPKRPRQSWPARETLPQFKYCKLEPYYSRNAVGLKMNSGKGITGVSQAWVSILFLHVSSTCSVNV